MKLKLFDWIAGLALLGNVIADIIVPNIRSAAGWSVAFLFWLCYKGVSS